MTDKPQQSSESPVPPYFLGVDVGGTNIKIGLVDNSGRTLAYESISTNATDAPSVVVERAAQTAAALAQQCDLDLCNIARCGLGTPGPICLKRRILLDPTNLPGLHNFPFADRLSEKLGIEVTFINDANAAAFGEFWIGAGRNHDSLAMFTLGTGVGGGLISEGHLINGTNSFGSELGHIIVDSSPDARLCNWGGGQGQLEAYASASAVALRAVEGIAAGAKTQLTELRAGTKISAYHVYKAAKNDDKFALELIDETAFYLGIGVTCAAHATDPGLVVLGGAMNFGGLDSPIGTRFLARISEEFRKRTFANVFEGTEITFATLGGDAGYIGAAGIARQDYQSNSAASAGQATDWPE